MKYQLIDMTDESMLAKGIAERIGTGGKVTHKLPDGRSKSYEIDLPTHTEAFEEVVKCLTDKEYGVVADLSEVSAVGHRIVQGAERFTKSELVTD